MTWVRLDDGFASHPKVLKTSDRSLRAFLVALCWSGNHPTNGRFPASLISARAATELVGVGLFERTESDEELLVHDFLDYNPSKEEIERDRRSARERMARVRENRQENEQENTTPNPGRVVTGTSEQEWFARFWEVWPRKVEKRAALRAFRAALKRATPEDLVGGAKRYRDDPNRRADFTKHPTTWLNGDCWLDEAEVAAPTKPEPEYLAPPPPPTAEEAAELAAAIAANPWSKKVSA